MARILVTGSADGLGRNAAAALLDDGHEVVVHARSDHRAADLSTSPPRGGGRRRRSRRPRADPVRGRSGQPGGGAACPIPDTKVHRSGPKAAESRRAVVVDLAELISGWKPSEPSLRC